LSHRSFIAIFGASLNTRGYVSSSVPALITAGFPAQFGPQPGARKVPIADDRESRNFQNFGRFFSGESTKETQLDYIAFSLVDPSQPLSRVIERKAVHGF